MEQADQQLEIIKLIVQLDTLQKKVAPVLPGASKKLVSDLLADGCTPRRLGQVVGRSASYMLTVAAGKKSLAAGAFVKLFRHALESRPQNVSE